MPVSVTDQGVSTFKFYVEDRIGDNNILRKVTLSSEEIKNKIIIESTNESTNEKVVICTDKGFDTYSAGRASLKVYWKDDNGTKTQIGQQDILVQNFANDITLKIDDPIAGELGTTDNPVYLERTTGNLSLTAQVKYEGGYLPKEVSSVLWKFANGYSGKEISPSDTTKSGLKVVSDTYTDPTDTYTADGKETTVKSDKRVFSLNGNTDAYYVIAQVPYNRRNGFSGDDNNINKSFYVKLTGPCEIALSSPSLKYGSSASDSVAITVTKCKNVDISIENADAYKDAFRVVKDTAASSDLKSVWKLQPNGDEQTIRQVIDDKKSITLIVNADHGIHEVPVSLGYASTPPAPPAPVTPSESTDPVDIEPSTTPDSDQKVILPERLQELIEQELGINQNTDHQSENQAGNDYAGDSGGGDSQDSSSASASTSGQSASSDAGTSGTTAAPSYTSPTKTVVAQVDVVGLDGNVTKVAVHVDGSVSETRAVPVDAVAAINDATTISSSAPTIVSSVNVVVDKKDASLNSPIEGVTAELQATTINGNISITPSMVTGVKDAVSGQFGDAAAKSAIDIKVNTLAADGKPLSVIVSTDSLKSNAQLKAYVIDPLTGGYVLVNIPNVKYDKKKGMVVSGLPGGFEYQLVSSNQAKQIENAIYNSVKLSSDFEKPVAVEAGGIVDISKAVSSELNASNVSKIEYTVAGNKASINPNTGLLVVNQTASKGTITVSIKVTLKNGKTKTIKAKLKLS